MTFELTLALGQPPLAPQTPVRVRGFKAPIDDAAWLTIKTCRTFGDGGYATKEELGIGDTQAQGPQRRPRRGPSAMMGISRQRRGRDS